MRKNIRVKRKQEKIKIEMSEPNSSGDFIDKEGFINVYER
jgi:hypothetical protein